MRLVVLMVVALAASLTSASDAKDAPSKAPSQLMRVRNSVVAIAAYPPQVVVGEAQPRRGFGIVVGQVGQRVTIIAPVHVIYGEDQDETPVSIEITLLDHDVTINAKALSNHTNRSHDLATIEATMPSSFEWCRRCYDARSVEGKRLWLVGRDARWEIKGETGEAHLEQPLSYRMRVSGLHVEPGSSGGALVSGGGLMGMVVRQTENRADAWAVTAESMQRFAREEGLNWQLSARRVPWKMTIVALASVAAYAALRKESEDRWEAYSHDPALPEESYDSYYTADQWRRSSGTVAIGLTGGAVVQWVRYWRAR